MSSTKNQAPAAAYGEDLLSAAPGPLPGGADAPANADVVDGEVIDDGEVEGQPGTDLVVHEDTTTEVTLHRLRKAWEYLEAPAGGEWGPKTTHEQKVSKATVEALFDAWPHMLNGRVVPKSFDVARLGRTAKVFYRKGRRDELIVKSAIAIPVVLDIFERTWIDWYGEPPQEADLNTVAHATFDLVSQGMNWDLVQEAAVKAAEEGHVFIGRAYREVLTRHRARNNGRRQTQGEAHASAFELAQRRQAEIDRSGVA